MATANLSTSSIKNAFAKYSGFRAKSLTSPQNYQPANTTRVFSLSCSQGTISADVGSFTQMGSLAIDTHINYTTLTKSYSLRGFCQPTSGSGVPATSSNSIAISGIPVLNGINATYTIWYKGTQQNATSQSYACPVSIFGDPRGSVYLAFGLSAGKIACGNGGVTVGTINVANDQWNMLTWVYKSSNQVDGYVNGVLDMSNAPATASPSNNNLDYLGATYPYNNIDAPYRLARAQIYSQALTQSQIAEIYNNERLYF